MEVCVTLEPEDKIDRENKDNEDIHPWNIHSDEPDDEPEEEDISLPLSSREDRPEASGLPVPPAASFQTQPAPPPQYRQVPPDQRFCGRGLAEAAITVAACLGLAAGAVYLPVLDIIAQIAFPLPLVVLIIRQGFWWGFGSFLALLPFSIILLGLPNTVMLLVQYGILSLFMGYCFRKGKKALFTFGFSVLISALGTVAGVVLSLFIAGLPASTLSSAASELIDQYEQMLASSGMESSLAAQGLSVQQMLASILDTFNKLLPAIMIVSGMLCAAVSYWLCAKCLRRRGYCIDKLPKFRDWRLDWRFSWGLILGLACGLAGDKLGIDFLSTVGINFLYVFGIMLFICGLAFLIWIGSLRLFSPFLIAILVFLMLIFPQFGIWLCILLAVFDPLLDLRKKLTAFRDKIYEQRQ